MTENLQERLAAHNSGKVRHTSKFLPWRIQTAVAFRDKDKAVAFEKYLKNHSGRAFAKKHFRRINRRAVSLTRTRPQVRHAVRTFLPAPYS